MPWDIYAYDDNLSDFNIYITEWKNAGVEAVYLASTDTDELNFLIPQLLTQCDSLGFYPTFYGADGYELYFTVDDI